MSTGSSADRAGEKSKHENPTISQWRRRDTFMGDSTASCQQSRHGKVKRRNGEGFEKRKLPLLSNSQLKGIDGHLAGRTEHPHGDDG